MKKTISIILASIFILSSFCVAGSAAYLKVPESTTIRYSSNYDFEVIAKDLPENATIAVNFKTADEDYTAKSYIKGDSEGSRLYPNRITADTVCTVMVIDKTSGDVLKDSQGNDMKTVVNIKCKDNPIIRILVKIFDFLHFYGYTEAGVVEASVEFNWK